MAEAEGKAGFRSENNHPPFQEHTWQSGSTNGKRADTINPAAQPPKQPQCPECGSTKIWRDGIRQNRNITIQRFLCRSCGYRFSQSNIEFNIFGKRVRNFDSGSYLAETPICDRDLSVKKSLNDSAFTFRENVASHSVTVVGKHLNSLRSYSSKRRVCAEETEAKNLEEEATRQELVTGATKLSEATVKGKLVGFVWFMQKEGYRPSTIKARLECIKSLVNSGMGPQLLHPDAIKSFIGKQSTWEDGYKRNVAYAYTTFLTMHGMTWNQPRYKAPDKLPFIPLESEIDQLVMSTGKRMSVFLQALKETAADPGELHAIKWIDINPQAKTIALNYPVKGHKARIINVSNELIERLNALPKTSEKVFQGNIYSIRRGFHEQRKTAARKLNNPRLLEINFTTFRHWKATMEYHKTKDPYHVKRLLGHNSLRTTEIYINIEQAIFKEVNDEFTVKVAENLDDACKLLEVGFEYITDMDGKKLFRKRK